MKRARPGSPKRRVDHYHADVHASRPSDDDGKLIGAPYRRERIEEPQDETDLDNRKVGELTIEELAEALARIQARDAA